ncbi:four-helix bundle copper-binding protein [Nocardiopsis sp. N85]|uniref:four-helix bundle copper-binding protein n=1 Tax=Nocardiopsis sp. N85 TaxID=3029400 RepID=UPI00237F0798|nr:four-helix bundle copper-binding protein [Nocardiopsis sp. N85]MDE3720454.1 four-helix bundle copper-binding protein [Nocardiopsis sp. N85]
MNTIEQMARTHPNDPEGVGEKVRACIEACGECAQACTLCADACLGEEGVADLVACVRSDLDCADLCETTHRLLSRRTARDNALLKTVLEACAQACRRCGNECERHAGHHEHCRVCAEVCRRCEDACRDLLAAL